jgi:hypothetical protein
VVADVLLALLHQAAGFKGVVLFSGEVICLTLMCYSGTCYGAVYACTSR